VEHEKALLARAIHDDLGGYLIASAMNVANLKRRFAGHDADALRSFDRLSRTLNGAIDMMRQVTEDLQPTLLDNVGLFAALRWQIKRMRHNSSITYIEHLPDIEPSFSHAAAIALYRVGQEALVAVEKHPGVKNVVFTMTVDQEALLMDVVADGSTGLPTEGTPGDTALGFLRHRISALGGQITVSYPEAGGMRLSSNVLLADALAFL
jgi:signal transduction histidine kinase